MTATQIDVQPITYEGRTGLIVKAGHRGIRRVVPPAGEAHAFDVDEYARRVDVWVSSTGRSVRVWVDGQEVRR